MSRPAKTATAAPLWRRFVAWIADGALALAPVGLAAVVPINSIPHTALLTVAFFGAVAIAIVNGIVLVARTGQSLGRRFFSIQVLDSRAMTPPNAGQVIFRNFIGGASLGFGWAPWFLHGTYLIISPWPFICYAFAFTDRRWHRGLNDRWAHTVVIDLARGA